MKRAAMAVGAMAMLVAFGGCSGEVSFQVGGKDPKDAAEDRIEQADFEEQVGLGPLTADCNDPGDVEAGDTFLCTADTSDGRTVQITATIEDEDSLGVRTTNLVTATSVSSLERAAVDVLNEQNGLSLPRGAVECGDGSVLLASDGTMPCVLTDANGAEYDATVTVTDVAEGDFSINVSGTPRS